MFLLHYYPIYFLATCEGYAPSFLVRETRGFLINRTGHIFSLAGRVGIQPTPEALEATVLTLHQRPVLILAGNFRFALNTRLSESRMIATFTNRPHNFGDPIGILTQNLKFRKLTLYTLSYRVINFGTFGGNRTHYVLYKTPD